MFGKCYLNIYYYFNNILFHMMSPCLRRVKFLFLIKKTENTDFAETNTKLGGRIMEKH